MVQEPLKLRFVGALVEQLGAQLYPSATATVAELVSNAWDADAKNVWVTIPLGERWSPESEITVLDDGHGMTRSQAQERYLQVGRKRRMDDGGETRGGRPLHGRKGIGKLAAFGTAERLRCLTLDKSGEPTLFELDYNKIRESDPGEDCEVEELPVDKPLTDPYDNQLDSGTLIRLLNLRVKRAMSQTRFIRSMSRRFAIDRHEMTVHINGEALERFDMDLEFRYPKDQDAATDGVTVDDLGWGIEEIAPDKTVRWWIGFTPKPLEHEELRGVSVIARGKMLQRPFMFGRSGGVLGQLGQEYLVGEVVADWLDTGVDVEDDLVQTNRDQLQLEDERVSGLLEWGSNRIEWALAQRVKARRQEVDDLPRDPEVSDLLEDFTSTERRILMNIARNAAKMGDPDPADIRSFMIEVINSHKDKAVRELIERVSEESDDLQPRFWDLVREFSLIDARRTYTVVQARLKTIERLEDAVNSGAKEIPDIHDIIKDNPWLIDPRMILLADEVDLSKFNVEWQPEIEESGARLDFLFALQPNAKAGIDEVLVVEIKRSRLLNGKLYSANHDHLYKFHEYVVAVGDHYRRNTKMPRVIGLMIADSYTRRADRLRTSLETSGEVSLNFSTWSSVIENTKRLHTSWLSVSHAASTAKKSG